MKCPVEKTLLIDYLEGELESRMAPELEEHLERCRACRTEFEALGEVLKMLDRVKDAASADQPPDSFWAENLETVAGLTYRKVEPRRKVITFRWPRGLHPAALAAAAVVLIALVGTFRLGLFRGDSAPVDQAAATQQELPDGSAMADSLYRIAETVYRYNLVVEAYEAIAELNTGENDDPAPAVTPGNSVYDGLLDLDDQQLEEVVYALASN